MGYPPGEELEDILRENFTPREATVALSLPTKVAPLELAPIDEIAQRIDLPREELVEILEDLSRRGLLYSGKTNEGMKGYALQQVGYGFPQAFFWKGENTPHGKRMTQLIRTYTKAKNILRFMERQKRRIIVIYLSRKLSIMIMIPMRSFPLTGWRRWLKGPRSSPWRTAPVG
jgi:hypothetical protein